jgi:hypothetical protein
MESANKTFPKQRRFGGASPSERKKLARSELRNDIYHFDNDTENKECFNGVGAYCVFQEVLMQINPASGSTRSEGPWNGPLKRFTVPKKGEKPPVASQVKDRTRFNFRRTIGGLFGRPPAQRPAAHSPNYVQPPTPPPTYGQFRHPQFSNYLGNLPIPPQVFGYIPTPVAGAPSLEQELENRSAGGGRVGQP